MIVPWCWLIVFVLSHQHGTSAFLIPKTSHIIKHMLLLCTIKFAVLFCFVLFFYFLFSYIAICRRIIMSEYVCNTNTWKVRLSLADDEGQRAQVVCVCVCGGGGGGGRHFSKSQLVYALHDIVWFVLFFFFFAHCGSYSVVRMESS